MRTANIIRKVLIDQGVMGVAEANDCTICKENNLFSGETGWHIIRTGNSPIFLGASLEAALSWIDGQQCERAQQGISGERSE